jgi:protein farnesyltransferase subunit beta
MCLFFSRAAYCAMTIICLLNLPLGLPHGSPAHIRGDETFLTRLPQWIGRCQTHEGGLADAPGHEAHGAYAFCGLACLAILGPPKTTWRYLDVPALIRWCSAQQRAPEAGFAGRTNKLVDGCYSHWVGACWSLLHAAVAAAASPSSSSSAMAELWSRDGLVRYVLSCCQNPRGGLRDKPGKPPDAYHSCYVLAGLAAAQHVYEYRGAEEVDGGSDGGGDVRTPLLSAFKWRVTDTRAGCWTEDDVVEPVHPVFVIAMDKVEEVRARYDRERTGGF